MVILKNKNIILLLLSFVLFKLITLSLIALSTNVSDVNFHRFTQSLNDCGGVSYEIDNHIMTLDMEYIGFGSYHCIKDGLSKSNKLIIENNFGGLIHESLLISKVIQERGISVHINNSCYSACTNLLFSSKFASINDGAMVASHQNNIHEYKSLNLVNQSIDRVKKHLLLKNSRGFDFDYYQNIINTTPYDSFYFYDNNELIKKGMITKISYLPKISI